MPLPDDHPDTRLELHHHRSALLSPRDSSLTTTTTTAAGSQAVSSPVYHATCPNRRLSIHRRTAARARQLLAH